MNNKTDVSFFWAMKVMRFRSRTERRLGQVGSLLAALAGLLWSGVLASWADTHYVSLAGENVAPYTNGWASAATQIQAAVNQAVVGDTVLVSNGTYTLTNQINILTNLTVKSLNGTNVTFINGNYPDYTNRCVYMKAGVLDGFTISNGYDAGTAANSGGGGVYLYEGNVTSPAVYNCFICKNYCSNTNTDSGGGGVYIKGNTTTFIGGTISNCSIVSNTVYSNSLAFGGGIFAYYGGLAIDSHISGNSAYAGGGVRLMKGNAIITNCTVANNRAIAGNGGGIYLQEGNNCAANCVISNNVCDLADAGGVYIWGGWVKNSIIIGNRARDGGGAVMLYAGVLSNSQVIANIQSNWTGGGGGMGGGGVYMTTGNGSVIDHCRIVSNFAKAYGGGLTVYSSGSGSHFVRNCLIYGNTNSSGTGGGVYSSNSGAKTNSFINCTIVANESRGVYLTAGYANVRFENCIVYSNKIADLDPSTGTIITSCWYTCLPTVLAGGQGNITNNPMLVDWLNHNYRVRNISPCVNAGTNQSWMTNAYDLDGAPRLDHFFNKVDMGAYEFQPSSSMFQFR